MDKTRQQQKWRRTESQESLLRGFRNVVKVGSLNCTKATRGSMNTFMPPGYNWGNLLTLNRSKQKSKLSFNVL